jgi:hypothetical protein
MPVYILFAIIFSLCLFLIWKINQAFEEIKNIKNFLILKEGKEEKEKNIHSETYNRENDEYMKNLLKDMGK